MRPAKFDPVAHARQIVYSYAPDPGRGSSADEAVTAALSGPQPGSLCAAVRFGSRPTPISQIITWVQIGLVAAIAANLGYIAAR